LPIDIHVKEPIEATLKGRILEQIYTRLNTNPQFQAEKTLH
jgi:hypothetical protein